MMLMMMLMMLQPTPLNLCLQGRVRHHRSPA